MCLTRPKTSMHYSIYETSGRMIQLGSIHRGMTWMTWSDLNDVIQMLCKSCTVWTTKKGTTKKISFPHTALSCYAKAWYNFICANLMPTRHQNYVTKDRVILLFGIVIGKRIDVGGIINTSITWYWWVQRQAVSPMPIWSHGYAQRRGCNGVLMSLFNYQWL